MMKLEQVKIGLFSFIENEIFPTMTGGQLWLSAFGLGVVRSQYDTIAIQMIEQYKHLLLPFGLINADNEINVEAAIEAAKDAAKKYGKLDVNIPMIGAFRLGESSFDTLHNYIINASQV